MSEEATSPGERDLEGLRAFYAPYRQHLQDACVKSQESFDKTVLSLSGGALGVSFIFLKDVIGSKPIDAPGLLVATWVAWAASSLAVLFSFHLSHLALRKAISQVDDGSIADGARPGGGYARATAWLNVSGAVLFFAGVVSIVIFASFNLTERSETHGNSTPTTSPAPASAAAATSRAGGARTP